MSVLLITIPLKLTLLRTKKTFVACFNKKLFFNKHCIHLSFVSFALPQANKQNAGKKKKERKKEASNNNA